MENIPRFGGKADLVGREIVTLRVGSQTRKQPENQ